MRGLNEVTALFGYLDIMKAFRFTMSVKLKESSSMAGAYNISLTVRHAPVVDWPLRAFESLTQVRVCRPALEARLSKARESSGVW